MSYYSHQFSLRYTYNYPWDWIMFMIMIKWLYVEAKQ